LSGSLPLRPLAVCLVDIASPPTDRLTASATTSAVAFAVRRIAVLGCCDHHGLIVLPAVSFEVADLLISSSSGTKSDLDLVGCDGDEDLAESASWCGSVEDSSYVSFCHYERSVFPWGHSIGVDFVLSTFEVQQHTADVRVVDLRGLSVVVVDGSHSPGDFGCSDVPQNA
jgi:hypothetical protein